MKDPVKEFENLNNRIEILFEGLGWLNPKSWFTDKPKYGQPNRTFNRGQAATQHLSDIDAEKSELGAFNKRFSSDPGMSTATFYNKKGQITGDVKNIKPFLQNAGITKATLRTYDLNKDPLKIRWLFDGRFEADYLDWNKKQKKVIFKGKWLTSTLPFNGIDANNQIPISKKTVKNPGTPINIPIPTKKKK